MTQREDGLFDEWDQYESYIQSGGQEPCLRESFLINHITRLTLRVQELEQPLHWHKFDKDDKTTWPTDDDVYWIFCEGIREIVSWFRNEPWDYGVQFWQPITIPSPPESEES